MLLSNMCRLATIGAARAHTRRLTRSHPIGSAPNPSQVTPEQRKAALEAKDAGNKEFTAGNYDAAAKHFTAAIEADPTDHGAQPARALPSVPVVRPSFRPKFSRLFDRTEPAR